MRPLYVVKLYLESWAPGFKKNGRNQEGLQGEMCCCTVAEQFLLAYRELGGETTALSKCKKR